MLNLIPAKKEASTHQGHAGLRVSLVVGPKVVKVQVSQVKISHVVFITSVGKVLILCPENSHWSEFTSSDFFPVLWFT